MEILPCASTAPVAVEMVVSAPWVADRADLVLPVLRKDARVLDLLKWGVQALWPLTGSRNCEASA